MGVIWVADAICEDQRDNARNAEESRDNILIILISHQYTVAASKIRMFLLCFRHFLEGFPSSNLNIFMSFEILMSRAVQYSPWKLNLVNFRLSYLDLKKGR